MERNEIETRFGIGTAVYNGAPATVVVVNDQVAPLTDIVARHGKAGMTAPLMRDLFYTGLGRLA